MLISCSSCGLINTIKNDIALHNFEKSLPSLEVESTIIEDYELSEVFNINGEDIELIIEDDEMSII